MRNILFTDYFDTIVHRSIPPEDVKKTWSKELAGKLNLLLDIYSIRFEVESLLCAENFIMYQESEFKYNDMCKRLFMRIEQNLELDYKVFTLICRELELKLEKQFQYLNLKNLSYLREAKKAKAKIFLVSDFYFDQELFDDLLNYHNISDLFDGVFISSEYMASKRSGRLYQQIKRQFKITNFEGASMIGDNKLADFENAQAAGINSNWYNAMVQHTYYKSITPDQPISTTLSKFENSFECYKDIVYPEIALALQLFIIKLYSKLVNNGAKDVLFMAREGEFLKKIFDQHVILVGGQIKSHYLFVSRRSTFLPSLSALSTENFNVLFRQYINISPKEFLLNLNFSEEQILSLTNCYECDINIRVSDFPNSHQFKRLKINQFFAQVYEANRLEQIRNFHQHIENMQINMQKIHIVDVGWKGSIQDNLANILKETKICGYYLGLNASASENEHSIKCGTLFDVNSAWDVKCVNSSYNECTALFEILLGASHGSTLKYLKNGNPVIIENEIEVSLFDKIINPLQKQMFEYSRLIDGIFLWGNYNLLDIERYVGMRYAEFIFAPSTKQLELFNDLHHVESFGVHETTKFSNQSYSVLKSIKIFMRNPRLYINTAFWPAQKLFVDGLSALIPLYKYNRMRKIKK